MVLQEEDDATVEAPLSKQTKKFVVVKNHVRELLPNKESSLLVTRDSIDGGESSIVKSKTGKRKRELQQVLPFESEPTHISKSDLEELKTVYRRCKEVLRNIETKYGDLMNLNDEESVSESNDTSEESESAECRCLRNKKIVFDENGQQIEKECQLGVHICPKRIKSEYTESQPQKPAVRIEYDSLCANLPQSLRELEDILKDTTIDKVYRQIVINKIYLIRQENINTLRYEKESLLKKLKENPDGVLDFKGANISSLPGYPTKPMKVKGKGE